jgi:hypothetical protein
MTLYSRYMNDWETRLANRDTNRVVRPFEWGLDWVGAEAANGNQRNALAAFVDSAVENSHRFFDHSEAGKAALNGTTVTFPSAVETPYPENNLARAEYFAARQANGRAVVVIPQWNSDEGGHIGLCKLLNKFGLSAIRLSPAFHHQRKPVETERADYHMSSNLGRTIQAMRQSAVDARTCLDWLSAHGYHRLGMLGTSLGSCIALLATAHDSRVKAAVFNHVSLHVADVVWSGMSCRHIREALQGHLGLEELRHYWSVISPSAYLDRLGGRALTSLLIWAKLDTTFRPELSIAAIQEFRERRLMHEVVSLPCGHYTSGEFPFHIWDGMAMCRFLRRSL